MLSDRDYMNKGGNQRPMHGGSEDNPNICIYVLIAINALVLFAVPKELDLYSRMALSPMGIKLGMYWQIITSTFLHGGLWHLLVNMWGLYIFGTLIAPKLKIARFLTLYFISGICGSLLWLAFNWNNPAFVVGASGALFGVLIATAMLEPDREFILLLFPVPMKTKTLVAIFAVLEIIQAQSSTENIAHLAHVGGLIGGYIFIRAFCPKLIKWEPFSFLLPLLPKNNRATTSSKGWTVHTAPLKFNPKSDFDFEKHSKDSEIMVTQKELDHLLDKVSRSGINSLSDAEMATLRKAREQMRKR